MMLRCGLVYILTIMWRKTLRVLVRQSYSLTYRVPYHHLRKNIASYTSFSGDLRNHIYSYPKDRHFRDDGGISNVCMLSLEVEEATMFEETGGQSP
jgi:hypothetical protein